MSEPWVVISATRRGALENALVWAQMITSLDRVIVVTAPRTDASIREQLAWYPSIHVAIQPRELGSAVELLHPLAHVLACDPLNRVVFVPADYHIVAPQVLAEALQTAEYTIAPHQVTLLGALPLDWSSGREPFIAAALVTTFWDLARHNLPAHARMFESYIAAIGTPAEDIALRGVFAELAPASLGGDLLARARTAAVVPLDPRALQLRVLSLGRAA